MSGDYQSIAIERRDQVATLVLKRRPRVPGQPVPNRHWELANAFDELRADSSIRVIVLTAPTGSSRCRRTRSSTIAPRRRRTAAASTRWTPHAPGTT